MLCVLNVPKSSNVSSIDAVEFSPDGRFLLVSGRGHHGTLIFDTTRLLQESPTLLQSAPYETTCRYDVDFSRDDELVALLKYCGNKWYKKLVVGRVGGEWNELLLGSIWQCVRWIDGCRVVIGGGSGKCYDVARQCVVEEFDLRRKCLYGGKTIWMMYTQPDNASVMAIGTKDGDAMLVDLRSMDVIHRDDDEVSAGYTDVSFSGDSRLLVSSSEYGKHSAVVRDARM